MVDRTASAAPSRYLYLDGIRGLAAMYVVLYHIRTLYDPSLTELRLFGAFGKIVRLIDFGHYAVPLFIVLSGFCLMLPVAMARRTDLAGGTKRYIVRRARRILPPYYAALLLSLAAVGFIPALRDIHGVAWDRQLPVFSAGGIISHLLMVHDVLPRWIKLIDAPMWSVAIEWHIYFLFPWIFLPSVRRIGIAATLVITTIASIILNEVGNGVFSYVSPQFLALFVAGMAAAMAVASSRDRRWRLFDHAWIFWILIAAAAACVFRFNSALAGRVYAGDLIIGVASAFVIAYLAVRTRARSVLRRVLETGPLVWLGTISYSLYLIHFPFLPLFIGSMRSASNRSMNARFATALAAGIVGSIIIAYVFHRLFERPWMTRHRTSERDAPVAAVTQPAP